MQIQLNNLKSIRISRGLTQKQVAIFMGKQCEDRISEWEQGKRMPSVQNLLKLCEIYQVTLKDIYQITPL